MVHAISSTASLSNCIVGFRGPWVEMFVNMLRFWAFTSERTILQITDPWNSQTFSTELCSIGPVYPCYKVLDRNSHGEEG